MTADVGRRPRPAVSVVCPTYNRSAAILPTLRSVLAQTWADLELLVVSDGSTDDTVEVVARLARSDPRVVLIELPHAGHPSVPRAAGLAAASAPIVAYLDHDDVWREDHLDRVVELVDGGADLVATGYVAVDGTGSEVRRSHTLDMCWHPELQVLDPMFEPSRVAHRAGLPDGVGGWRVTRGLEDWDLWFRLTEAGHRFRTTTHRTVRVHESPGTRRHQVPPAYLAPLVTGPDPRALKGLHDATLTPRWAARLHEAARQDGLERLGRLTGLVRPVGPEQHAAAGPPDPDHGSTPVVVPWRGGYALAMPVFCSTDEHAEQVRTLLPRHARRQLDVLAEVAGGLGLDARVERPARSSSPNGSIATSSTAS